MARSHGRIMTSIWNDGDFLALPGVAQRLYLFLLSQSDLTHAGLLPLRVRRWAAKVADATPESIRSDLAVLADRRFVVVDEDTEEVLVRTFVRGDGVYKQPKVMLRLREDARLIESPVLRSAFLVELDRLPLGELTPNTRKVAEEVADNIREDFGKGIGNPSGNPSERVSAAEPVDNEPNPGDSDITAGQNPSERVSDTPGEGYPIPPRARAGAFPQPPAPSPLPPATIPATPGAVALRDDDAPTAQTLIAEWIDHCDPPPPGRVKGQVAKEVGQMLKEGIPYERVRSGLAAWQSRGLHPATLPSVVHEQSTNGGGNRRQAETDSMFDRAMRRAEERERNSR